MPDMMATEHARDAPADETFGIALALSGAISAGAYTAGVLDFLIQALDAWERARHEPGTPGHRACITVIAGASAGAVTGALGLVALARGLRPVPFEPGEGAACHEHGQERQTIRCVLPALHDAWVVGMRMGAPPGQPSFLSLDDLAQVAREPVHVQSLLNARMLDGIKQASLAAPAGTPAGPATRPGSPRPAAAGSASSSARAAAGSPSPPPTSTRPARTSSTPVASRSKGTRCSRTSSPPRPAPSKR